MRRRRGLRSAEDLLRLVLIDGATPPSPRTTAVRADVVGVAALSDVARLDRLQGIERYLRSGFHGHRPSSRRRRPIRPLPPVTGS